MKYWMIIVMMCLSVVTFAQNVVNERDTIMVLNNTSFVIVSSDILNDFIEYKGLNRISDFNNMSQLLRITNKISSISILIYNGKVYYGIMKSEINTFRPTLLINGVWNESRGLFLCASKRVNF